MQEKTLVATLKFSIAGSTLESTDTIKKVFSELPVRIVLHTIYRSAKSFITANYPNEKIDFIAIDKYLFTELEETGQLVAVPLLVFTDDLEPINSAHNIIFDTIRIPVMTQNLLNTVSKIQVIKKYFEKNTNGSSDLTNITTNDFTKTFLIKRGRDFQLINTDNISIFYTDNKLTFGFDGKGNKFIVQATLIELESQLNTTIFFRANRQSLINRKFISKIKQLDEGRYEIIIEGTDALRIDINQQKFSKLRDWIENN